MVVDLNNLETKGLASFLIMPTSQFPLYRNQSCHVILKMKLLDFIERSHGDEMAEGDLLSKFRQRNTPTKTYSTRLHLSINCGPLNGPYKPMFLQKSTMKGPMFCLWTSLEWLSVTKSQTSNKKQNLSA